MAAERKLPDWFQLDEEITSDVTRDGLERVRAITRGATETERLLRRFNLAVRAGDDKSALNALVALEKAQPRPSAGDLSHMADFLIGRELWALTRQFLIAFPEANPGWGYVFIKRWREGASTDAEMAEIDRFLTRLSEQESTRTKQKDTTKEEVTNPDAGRPMRSYGRGETAYGEPPSYWLQERMRFREDLGTGQALIKEMEAELRGGKADPVKVARFIAACRMLNHGRKVNLEWLPGAFMPRLALEQFLLGEKLKPWTPKVAAHYLEHSLKTPVSPADRKQLAQLLLRFSSMPVGMPQDGERLLRSWTKQGLANCYQRTGKPEMAHKLLVELSKETGSQMPSFALTQSAGQVQAQLPSHPLEKMIEKAEPENRNSCEYWLGRARYYQGRKDEAKVVEAFKQALDITKSVEEKPADEVSIMRRRMAVDEYCRYLLNTNRGDQAMAIWWHEFENTKSAVLRERILNSIWSADRKELKYDDERLWRFLSERKEWDFMESHLLNAMVESKGVDKGTFFQRAEKLAAAGGLSRAYTVGWVMTKNDASLRAIPLLKKSAAALTDKRKKESAEFALFEAYLKSNQWHQAERQWPAARAHLTPGEIPEWLAKIALCAAKSGAREDALRLWREKDQIDRTYVSPLAELSRLRLKRELLRHYATMEKEVPSSTVPFRARKMIGG